MLRVKLLPWYDGPGLHRLAQLLCHRLASRQSATWQHHGKFVAAHAGSPAQLPHLGFQQPRHMAQRIVARVMPCQVIHHGEMVQVHEQHHALACSRSMRRRTVIAQTGGALGQQGSQTLVKRRTVEQLGQRIVLGLPGLLLLRLTGRA